MSSPFVVLVRGDDGPDVYGPYDEDEVVQAAWQIGEVTGLETEARPLMGWGFPKEVTE